MHSTETHHFIPGHGAVPEVVRKAMRSGPVSADLPQSVTRDMQRLFGTAAEVLLFPGSATSAWELAMMNTLMPGDKVLMARHGQFSSLWVDMARMLGLIPVVVDAPWGAPLPVAEFDRILGRDVHGEIKAVLVTHCETSTGALSDVAAVRRALDSCFHEALLMVDAVSTLGAMRFEMDAWGVDLAVTAAHKALMLPEGLSMLALGERALAAARCDARRPAYRDFSEARAARVPHPLLRGLRAALDRVAAGGDVAARHARLAEALRRGAEAMGLTVVAACGHRADTVTALRLPAGVDARQVLHIAREECNAIFGAGLGPLQADVIRVGHMGDVDEGRILSALSLMELALMRTGVPVPPGAGVAAALDWLTGLRPPHPYAIAAE
ncbi:pyridoxal-phosphate-dependent aminotransferase family protein [Antarctobacter jejuensis]|uniref:pyridoxal-phosphate-dependent aminotransferase family protein n=1 Tax=Antarctobacter jejuensis TaxID=1439938 RepID=UPI003FCFB854